MRPLSHEGGDRACESDVYRSRAGAYHLGRSEGDRGMKTPRRSGAKPIWYGMAPRRGGRRPQGSGRSRHPLLEATARATDGRSETRAAPNRPWRSGGAVILSGPAVRPDSGAMCQRAWKGGSRPLGWGVGGHNALEFCGSLSSFGEERAILLCRRDALTLNADEMPVTCSRIPLWPN
jgi:hypothetical protein